MTQQTTAAPGNVPARPDHMATPRARALFAQLAQCQATAVARTGDDAKPEALAAILRASLAGPAAREDVLLALSEYIGSAMAGFVLAIPAPKPAAAPRIVPARATDDRFSDLQSEVYQMRAQLAGAQSLMAGLTSHGEGDAILENVYQLIELAATNAHAASTSLAEATPQDLRTPFLKALPHLQVCRAALAGGSAILIEHGLFEADDMMQFVESLVEAATRIDARIVGGTAVLLEKFEQVAA